MASFDEVSPQLPVSHKLPDVHDVIYNPVGVKIGIGGILEFLVALKILKLIKAVNTLNWLCDKKYKR